MNHRLENFVLVCLLVFLSGCIYALQPSNPPYHVKLRLDTCGPEYYRVLVATKEMKSYAFGTDGRVDFIIPELGKGCRLLILGIPVSDDGATGRKAIYIFGAERIIKNLSIKGIEELPVGSDDYRILKIK